MLSIVEGEAQITVADRTYTARAGDVVIVNPIDVHSVRCEEEGIFYQRCVCFDGSLVSDRAIADGLNSGEISVSGIYTADSPFTAEIRDNFDRLFSAVSENSDALFLESVAYISLIFAALKKGSFISRTKKSDKKARFTRKVQEYLREHFHEQITSLDMAAALFYTHSYFCRLFREEFGVPFLEYLMMYRIARAKIMLSSDEVSVMGVAASVGIFDPSYFSKCFKRIVGVSPFEYKKSQFCMDKMSI